MENWEADISPGQAGYIPSAKGTFLSTIGMTRRERKHHYAELLKQHHLRQMLNYVLANQDTESASQPLPSPKRTQSPNLPLPPGHNNSHCRGHRDVTTGAATFSGAAAQGQKEVKADFKADFLQGGGHGGRRARPGEAHSYVRYPGASSPSERRACLGGRDGQLATSPRHTGLTLPTSSGLQEIPTRTAVQTASFEGSNGSPHRSAIYNMSCAASANERAATHSQGPGGFPHRSASYHASRTSSANEEAAPYRQPCTWTSEAILPHGVHTEAARLNSSGACYTDVALGKHKVLACEDNTVWYTSTSGRGRQITLLQQVQAAVTSSSCAASLHGHPRPAV